MSTPKEIAEAVICALDERRSVQECEHAEHHQFIKRLIDREEERRAMYADLRRHLAKWGAVGLLGFIGTAIWYWVKNHLTP